MSKRISKEELSDEQIQEILEEFTNLSEEERGARLLGEGAYKRAYNIPNTNFVLKKPIGDNEISVDDMAREYAINKRLRDKIDLELPILVAKKTDAGIEPYHIQRKVTPLENQIKENIGSLIKSPEFQSQVSRLNDLYSEGDKLWELRNSSIKSGDLDSSKKYGEAWRKNSEERSNLENYLKSLKNKIRDKFSSIEKNIESELEGKGLVGADIHSGNVTPEGKVFDLGSWVGYDRKDVAKNNPLNKTRKNIVDRVISNPKFKPTYGIFRSLLPMIGKGALTAGAGLASLAAEASDATEEGSSREEAAMQREMQEDKLKKAIGEDAYYASKQNMRNTSPMGLLDPMAGRPQFRNLRNKIK
jgi:hypothetical protein